MSAAEITELLGISRQRVDKIAKTDPTFPKPVAVLRRIRVWETADVEKWARATGRIK
jgi:predicted DNA-binding transcriptional regulator AlpA